MSEIKSSSSDPVRAAIILPVGLTVMSFASIFIRFCDAPPLIIAAYRLTLATLILLLLALPRTLRESRRLSRKEILPSLAAGLFLCFHFAFWITSLQYTTVASSVIFVTTNPIFVAVASTFILRERISLALLVSILMAVVGGTIIGWGDLGKGRDQLYGDFLSLLGAVMATGYLLVGRRVRQKVSLTTYITLVYGGAALFLILLALFKGDAFFGYAPKDYLLFLLLAVGPQLIGHSSLNWALRFFSATLVAVVILGEPIGASILAYFILGENPGINLIWGGALVLLGIYLSTREEKKLGKI
ncbi:MAG TPA: DMT family transporter [Thermodesulfobacteriota bacterium]|nr:DMT family transporter [Thermodesulfobacteriota bacterium]